MPATTTLLGLVTPTQGTLSGTWGDTVNYGITDYVDIAIAGTLSFAGDGAITLANTLGSASGNGFTSTTAQYMVIRVTGTLTTPKIITGPSYSKLYMVDNSATGSTVSFIRAGQTPAVSVAVGEKCFVYYNGTDYVKVASSVADGVTTIDFGSTGLTPNTATSGAVTVAGTLAIANGGTGTSSTTFVNAATNVTGLLPIANGGTATATPSLVQGTNVTITGTWPNQTINAAGAAQVYPGAGIANSTGTAWGTSYTTTGTGTVVALATSPTFVTPNLGVPSFVTLTSATGLPLTTGVTGTLPNTNGGTGQNSAFTQYGVTYADTATSLATTAAGTAGYVLTANSSAAPTFQAIPAAGVSQAKATMISFIFGF